MLAFLLCTFTARPRLGLRRRGSRRFWCCSAFLRPLRLRLLRCLHNSFYIFTCGHIWFFSSLTPLVIIRIHAYYLHLYELLPHFFFFDIRLTSSTIVNPLKCPIPRRRGSNSSTVTSVISGPARVDNGSPNSRRVPASSFPRPSSSVAVAVQIPTGILDVMEFPTTPSLKPTAPPFGYWFPLSNPLNLTT